MSNENSAETQEEVDAYLDRELSELPPLPIVPKLAPAKLPPKAAFDAKRAADKARDDDLFARALAAIRDRKSTKTAEGLRDRKARNKREQRARELSVRDTFTQTTADDLAALQFPPAAVDLQLLASEAAARSAWLSTPGRSQGGLRRIEQATAGDLMASRAVYLAMLAEFGVLPSWQIFADRLSAATGRTWSREQARRRQAKFEALEGPTGPWEAR